MKSLQPMMISGREVLPLVEGGKGVSISNGESAGAWAAAGAVGTLSCVNADSFDADGNPVPQVYHSKTRRDRFDELVKYAIDGGITQVRIAHEKSGGRGRIHMNVLWEAGGTERILHGVLDKVNGMVHGVTCGAGMPYRLSEIAAKYNIHYYPIVSSARAFRALWKRSYHKTPELLGGVVYEDPWLAGGHNGLSNVEDPLKPQLPFERVQALRTLMNEYGLNEVPILMAGGVWYLRDWQDWIGNPDLGPVAFQFGTRTILTKESPVCEAWRERYLSLKEGDIYLNKFSPTGFYSSAVRNDFLNILQARSDRQVPYTREPIDDHTEPLPIGVRGRAVYLTKMEKVHAEQWIAEGFTEAMRTPDSTLIFVTPEMAKSIVTDQQDCMGCLSQCRFSNWADNEDGNTGKRADPRSFCIQKTLQSIAHGGEVDKNLMFAGHNAFKFSTDPFYSNGFIPTVKELVDRLCSGD